jgi:hypothetical protein
VGRFFAVDPLFKSFPWNSTYAFSENRVIDGVELEGQETEWFMLQVRAGMYGKSAQQIVNGIDKSVKKSVDGLIFIATNPKEAIKGTGNFLLGAAIKGTGAPSSVSNSTLQSLDLKFGTSTYSSTQAFEKSLSESADKLINGNLEDKTEIITDIATFYYSPKITKFSTEISGLNKIIRHIKPRIFSKNFVIGTKTYEKVAAHLEQFGNKAENVIMLERMKKIVSKELKPTEIDLNFAKHELRESQLMKQEGLTYEQAHMQTLIEQNMYHQGYEKKLYTKEALDAGDQQLINEASRK